MPMSSRSTPMLTAASLLLAALAVGAILLVGGCGTDPATPVASATSTAAPPSAAPTPTVASPEDAVRAFFAAYAAARTSGDPVAVRDLVTGDEAPALLSVEGFLDGQAAAGKASVVTVQRLDNVSVSTENETATVTFDYTEGGYDIRREDASPLESPQVLPPRRVTVTLRRIEGRWLVESFESAQ